MVPLLLGDGDYGGSGAPSDSGYIGFTPREPLPLKTDGYYYLGDSGWWQRCAQRSGYTRIYSTWYAFAAIKADGSITTWGDSAKGGGGAPTDSGYVKIYSTYGGAFAAIKADGSITTWGDSNNGGSGAPSGSRYSFEPLTQLNTAPSVTITAPAANTSVNNSYTIGWTASDPDNQASISLYYDTDNSGNDGTLITDSLVEGTHTSYNWDTSSLANGDYYIYAKIDDGVNQPVYAYGAGVITADFYPDLSSAMNNYGGYYNAPNGSNYYAFATLTADGSITAWGNSTYGGGGAPAAVVILRFTLRRMLLPQ